MSEKKDSASSGSLKSLFAAIVGGSKPTPPAMPAAPAPNAAETPDGSEEPLLSNTGGGAGEGSMFRIDLNDPADGRGESRYRMFVKSDPKLPAAEPPPPAPRTPYTQDDFDRFVERGHKDEATAAANDVLAQLRLAGRLRDTLDVYQKLHKRFPDAVPDVEEVRALLMCGLMVSRLPMAELAMRHLTAADPDNPDIVKRLPEHIRLCAQFRKTEVGLYWLTEYDARNGPAEAVAEWRARLREQQAEDRAREEELRKGDQVSYIYEGRYEEAYMLISLAGKAHSLTSIELVRLAEGLTKNKKWKEAADIAYKIPFWFPNTPEAAQGLYISAWLAAQVFHDTEKAITLLQDIRKFYPQSRFAVKADELLARLRGESPPSSGSFPSA